MTNHQSKPKKRERKADDCNRVFALCSCALFSHFSQRLHVAAICVKGTSRLCTSICLSRISVNGQFLEISAVQMPYFLTIMELKLLNILNVLITGF